MINSRSIEDLIPSMQILCKAHIAACAAVGIDLLVTSTYRDAESQSALYAQGRTKPGKIVTNARAGESYHNFQVAYDVVPIRNGKPVWDINDPSWAIIGTLGEKCGLDWAGRWIKFKEFAHFQKPGLTLAKLHDPQFITSLT